MQTGSKYWLSTEDKHKCGSLLSTEDNHYKEVNYNFFFYLLKIFVEIERIDGPY